MGPEAERYQQDAKVPALFQTLGLIMRRAVSATIYMFASSSFICFVPHSSVSSTTQPRYHGSGGHKLYTFKFPVYVAGQGGLIVHNNNFVNN